MYLIRSKIIRHRISLCRAYKFTPEIAKKYATHSYNHSCWLIKINSTFFEELRESDWIIVTIPLKDSKSRVFAISDKHFRETFEIL